MVPSSISLKNYGNLSSSINLSSACWNNPNSISHKKIVTSSYSVNISTNKIKEDFIS